MVVDVYLPVLCLVFLLCPADAFAWWQSLHLLSISPTYSQINTTQPTILTIHTLGNITLNENEKPRVGLV